MRAVGRDEAARAGADGAGSILIAIAGVPGVLVGAVLVEIPQLGRKWAMVCSSAMMALSLFLYATVTTFDGSVALNAMEYFCAFPPPPLPFDGC